jgi:hypothetical protein
MWVYFSVDPNPDDVFIVEEAELGMTDLYLVIGQFYFDAEQNLASLLLIHMEPLEES